MFSQFVTTEGKTTFFRLFLFPEKHSLSSNQFRSVFFKASSLCSQISSVFILIWVAVCMFYGKLISWRRETKKPMFYWKKSSVVSRSVHHCIKEGFFFNFTKKISSCLFVHNVVPFTKIGQLSWGERGEEEEIWSKFRHPNKPWLGTVSEDRRSQKYFFLSYLITLSSLFSICSA